MYPTDVLVTGFDIIFLGGRMIMMGLKFTNQVPFKESHTWISKIQRETRCRRVKAIFWIHLI